jgi:hypothetical protein
VVDHTSYIRRYLGYDLYEETYGLGVGRVADDWELHLTGFAGDPVTRRRTEPGGAAMAEVRWGPTSLGASARTAFGSTRSRHSAGVFARWYWEAAELLTMAEVDGIYETFHGVGARNQLAAYLGPVWNPVNGLYFGVTGELFDENVRLPEVRRLSASAWTSWLPFAHFEVLLSLRAQRIGPVDSAYAGTLQLHYYP